MFLLQSKHQHGANRGTGFNLTTKYYLNLRNFEGSISERSE